MTEQDRQQMPEENQGAAPRRGRFWFTEIQLRDWLFLSFAALTHPVLLLLFALTISFPPVEIFGYKSFYGGGQSVRINLYFFIPFAFISYFLWISFKMFLFEAGEVAASLTLRSRINYVVFALAPFNAIHLQNWVYGLGGIHIVFLVLPYSIIVIPVYFISFLVQSALIASGKYDTGTPPVTSL